MKKLSYNALHLNQHKAHFMLQRSFLWVKSIV